MEIPYDMDEEGNVVVHPVVGFQMAVVDNGLCIVRIEYRRETAPTAAIQLVVSVDQVRDLIGKLEGILELATSSRSSGHPMN
jgi:hypothetical protein